jgi:hypothetical protein
MAREKQNSKNETVIFLENNRERIKEFILEKPRKRSEIAIKLGITNKQFDNIYSTASFSWPIYEIDEEKRESLVGWLDREKV